MIITSGQIPVDPQTHEMVREIKAATLTVLNNLISVVEEGGGDRTTVAKVDVFVRSLSDFDAINQVYSEFFGDSKPGQSTGSGFRSAGRGPAGSRYDRFCKITRFRRRTSS